MHDPKIPSCHFGVSFKLSFDRNKWKLIRFCPVQCWWFCVLQSPNDTLGVISFVLWIRTGRLFPIRIVSIPGGVFQSIICGKQVKMDSVVSCSVLVPGCAQNPEWYIVRDIFRFLSKNRGIFPISIVCIPGDIFQGINCGTQVKVDSVVSWCRCLGVLRSQVIGSNYDQYNKQSY